MECSSETSERALHKAINLATDQQSALRIIYAVDKINTDISSELVNAAELIDAAVAFSAQAYTGEAFAKHAKVTMTEARAIALKAHPGK